MEILKFFIFLVFTLQKKHVFFDIAYTNSNGNDKSERIIIKLYTEMVPKTCHNFLSFVEGVAKNGKTYTYKGNIFHRIIPDFMIQGGDVTRADGRGGFSVYGERFKDENFEKKHTGPGILSMANAGPDTNGSQFFITVAKTSHLDGKHVVFGEVLDKYMGVIYEISNVNTDIYDKPLKNVTITDCGIIKEKDKIEL